MTFLLRKPLANASRRIALCLLTFSALDVTALAQRELKDIPVPNAEVEKATFVVDEGWQAELYAGDPAMAKPIHMSSRVSPPTTKSLSLKTPTRMVRPIGPSSLPTDF